MFDPEVNGAVQRLTEALADQHPEVGKVIEMLKAGDLNEASAMQRLMPIVAKKGIGGAIEKLAAQMFAPLRMQGTTDIQADDAPFLFTKDKIVRLNPLMESAIHERVQFDGDVPELRFGPMPPGTSPAVPVVTTARNPVAIGKQLMQASNDIMGEVQEAQHQAIQQAEEERALALIQGTGELGLPRMPTGVEGYEAGQLPVPREVEAPAGSALAAMTIEERQQSAYKALSTTQGRRSALAVIEELVLVGLKSEGYNIPARAPGRAEDVPVYADWVVRLSGHGASQSNFSFLDVAAKVLLRKLLPQLEAADITDPVLEVSAVNTVDVRQVGWAARIVSGEG